MLQDYINQYIQATLDHNQKRKREIERDLASLGMDKRTLIVLALETAKQNLIKKDAERKGAEA